MPLMKIDANEISAIHVKEASMNMVLFVHQRNSNRPIVVKGEEGKGRQNVGAMLEFHASAFSKLRALPFETERVSTDEIEQLRRCDPSKIELNPKPTREQWGKKLGALLYGKSEDVPNELDKSKLKAVVKISYVEELADLKGLAQKDRERQLLASSLEAGETAPVFALGQILAVDFFIGNFDRFRDSDTASGKFRRGAIIGEQNVFFQFRNDKITPIGLDTFDSAPLNFWSDLTKPIEPTEQRTGKAWPGRILAPGATNEREAAATALVESLVQMAGANVGRKAKSKLVEACHRGVSDGKTILRAKYKLGDNAQSLSEGIGSRWMIIRGK
jgi:hypothetical protein